MRIHFSNEYEVTTSVWRLGIRLRIRNVSSSSKNRLGAVNHNLIFAYPQSEVTTSGLRIHFSNEYEVTTSGSRIHFSNECGRFKMVSHFRGVLLLVKKIAIVWEYLQFGTFLNQLIIFETEC